MVICDIMTLPYVVRIVSNVDKRTLPCRKENFTVYHCSRNCSSQKFILTVQSLSSLLCETRHNSPKNKRINVKFLPCALDTLLNNIVPDSLPFQCGHVAQRELSQSLLRRLCIIVHKETHNQTCTHI